MPIKIRKTILVGLGGTGVRALVHIKREFLKHFGEVPPTLKLIGFDTNTGGQAVKLQGREIRLTDAEFMSLTVTNIRELVDRTPEIAAWIPPPNKRDLRDIRDGAGGRRTSGRLALFADAPAIYERLKIACDQVSAITSKDFATRSQRLVLPDEDQPTYIFIICSLAGGTGGGMFLDISYFCRRIWRGASHRIFGVFLLPGIFAGQPATRFVEGNGYAALKELDYWLNQDTSVEVQYPGLGPITWGGELNEPLDFICLLDNANEMGKKVLTVDHMLQFVARSVFLYMTVEGMSWEGQPIPDFWSNVKAILGAATPWDGKYPNYMSFGISSLEIPVEDILNQTVSKCVLNLIENDLVPPDQQFKDGVQAYVGNTVVERQLKGENLMDAVISSAYTPNITPLDKPWTKTLDIITQWRTKTVDDLRNDFQREASQNSPRYQSTLHAKEQVIEQELGKLLHNKGGIGNAKLFLQTLINTLRSERSGLEKKAQEARQELEEMEKKHQDLEEKEVKLAFTRGPFSKRTAVSEAYQKLYAQVAQHRDLLRDAARAQVGVNLLAALVTKAGEYLDSIQELERRLNQAARCVRERLQRPDEMPVPEDLFTGYLREGFLDPRIEAKKPTINIELLFNKWEERVREAEGAKAEATTLLGMARLSEKDLAQWLLDAVQAQFMDIQQLTIEDILSDGLQQARERTKEAIQQFVKQALPMWGIIEIPAAKQPEVVELPIFGVPDTPAGLDGSMFKRYIESGEIGLPGRGKAFTTTWERYSIRVLRLKVPVPLYVIKNLQDYKAKYLQVEDDPDARITHHIHRDWMGSKGLPDIFPYEVGP